MELKYKVEYFISQGRSYDDGFNYLTACRKCRKGFKRGNLRFTARVQSFKFDGKNELLYHFNCFFEIQRPDNIGQIENFENLRYEDQQKIKEKLESFNQIILVDSSQSSKSSSVKSNKSSKAKKRPLLNKAVLKDFGIEYSVSGRAECVGCRSKIMKNVVRVKKIVYTTEVGMRYGGQPFWHHLECFSAVRLNEYGYFLGGENLIGFGNLSAEDQQLVKDMIPEIVDGPKKKNPKIATKQSQSKEEEKPKNNLEATIADQTKRLFEIRDQVKVFATPAILRKFFTSNSSGVVEGFEKQLDRCADFLTFGAIDKCKRCSKGDFIFEKYGYKCNGSINAWTECGNFVYHPLRSVCKIPDNFKKSNKENLFKTFLQKSVEDRAVRPYVKYDGSNAHDVKVQRKREPLYNMHVVPFGKISMTRPQMKIKVEAMGGKLVTKLQPMIAVVISSEEDVEKMGARMREIKSLNIQVVPESFLDSIANGSPADTLEAIKTMNIAEWGSDPLSRIPQEEAPGQKESIYSKGSKKVANVKLKNGAAIGLDSGLSEVAHVYKREGILYTSVLGLADISKNKNSYFKIQVLQSDDSRQFWLFSSWGRIGTKVGDSKKEEYSAAEMACVEFERLYKSKTGNNWNDRNTFEKHAGKFYPIEVDYEDDTKLKTIINKSTVPSKLSEPVQDLVKMLFDLDFMKQTMMEFDLDMVRMPLGRLSRKQLEEANKTLSDLSDLTARGASDAEFIGLSNKFYTLVPHNFGMKQAPVIDTLEMIKNKREMVESLNEIEIAYSMLQEETNDDLNPLDCRYEQLKTELKPLDRETEEFKLIEQYVENTHAETHSTYKLVIEDVFQVKRQGEAARYKPFKKLHNRQLLWHGSRLTNFVGILSHGLKIAPPEAPATGYMFGKGIYFADMVSKSANYCFTSPVQQTGLMLLSEVALGDTHDLLFAQNIKQLPEGKHSVKGYGKTFPNPDSDHKRKDGVNIPLGKAITNKDFQSELLYNEFIVYDVAQVNVQYLLKMKFDYTRSKQRI